MKNNETSTKTSIEKGEIDMEEKQMIAADDRGLTLQSFADIQRFANAAVQAGYWKDLKSVAQAAMKVQMGLELGMKPIQAFTRIHVIEGKPSLSAEAMGALVKASGKYRLIGKQSDDEAAEVAVYERNGDKWDYLGSGRFTMDNAKSAGLGGRHNWKAYGADMLWARAMSRACRRHCSDVTMGFYALEDFNARETQKGVEFIQEEKPEQMNNKEPIIVEAPKLKKKKVKKKVAKPVDPETGQDMSTGAEVIAVDPNDSSAVYIADPKDVRPSPDMFGRTPDQIAQEEAEHEKRLEAELDAAPF